MITTTILAVCVAILVCALAALISLRRLNRQYAQSLRETADILERLVLPLAKDNTARRALYRHIIEDYRSMARMLEVAP